MTTGRLKVLDCHGNLLASTETSADGYPSCYGNEIIDDSRGSKSLSDFAERINGVGRGYYDYEYELTEVDGELYLKVFAGSKRKLFKEGFVKDMVFKE
jgi:hypothetical protein